MYRTHEKSMHAEGPKLTCERCLADGNDLDRQAAVAIHGDRQLPAHGQNVWNRCSMYGVVD